MKKIVVVFVVLFVLGLPGVVRAEVVPVEELVVDEVVVDASDVVVPDVESRWFGLRWAFEMVSHNIQMVFARTDERKALLEIRLAEKEDKLIARIAELSESNPELAEKFSSRLERMVEKNKERVERVRVRVEKLEGREGEMKEKMERWVERREEVEEKIKINRENSGQTLNGGNVKIQNARPGIIEMR